MRMDHPKTLEEAMAEGNKEAQEAFWENVTAPIRAVLADEPGQDAAAVLLAAELGLKEGAIKPGSIKVVPPPLRTKEEVANDWPPGEWARRLEIVDLMQAKKCDTEKLKAEQRVCRKIRLSWRQFRRLGGKEEEWTVADREWRRFVLITEEGGIKYWEIRFEERGFSTRQGAKRRRSRTVPSEAEALGAYHAIINRKKRLGYEEVQRGHECPSASPPEPKISDAEAERKIQAEAEMHSSIPLARFAGLDLGDE